MGIFNEYPYTDSHELNLDWILKKIKEFQTEVESIETTILEQAKSYTDQQITERLANVEKGFADFKKVVDGEISALDESFDAFVITVNSRMAIADANIRDIAAKVNSVLGQANAYTNQAIMNNNEYIIDQTTKALATVTVLNYFTGARVSIQEMFDYLAKFHLQNAISVSTLVARAKTVNQLIALNMTMTDLATNGGTIITP